jgi:hypothetical protein
MSSKQLHDATLIEYMSDGVYFVTPLFYSYWNKSFGDESLRFFFSMRGYLKRDLLLRSYRNCLNLDKFEDMLEKSG